MPTFNKSNRYAIARDCGRCFSFPGSLQKIETFPAETCRDKRQQHEILNMKYMGLLLDGEQWLIIKYAFVKSVKKHIPHQCSSAVCFFYEDNNKKQADAGLLNTALVTGIYSFIHFFHVGLLIVY